MVCTIVCVYCCGGRLLDPALLPVWFAKVFSMFKTSGFLKVMEMETDSELADVIQLEAPSTLMGP